MQKRKHEIERENARLVREVDAMRSALHFLGNRIRPDAVERFKEPQGRGRYRIELYGSKGAAGGLLVFYFSYPGARDSISVRHFEEYEAEVRGLSNSQIAALEWIALERLRCVRDRIALGDPAPLVGADQ